MPLVVVVLAWRPKMEGELLLAEVVARVVVALQQAAVEPPLAAVEEQHPWAEEQRSWVEERRP